MDNVVNITLRDPLNIRVETDDYEYLKQLKEHFTYYVDGFRFTPQYKAGKWNGKVCLMRLDGSVPYGLLTELIRINKREFPRVITVIDEEVKRLFLGPELEIKQDLTLKPYPYQLDCIKKALKYTKGIIRSATASGKSTIIAYIAKTLLENGLNKCIIIVPNKSLVEQFYNDMKEYGVPFPIGRVYQKYKEWNESIVIATWQTIMKNHDKLSLYDCVIVDECVDGDTKIKTVNGEKSIKDIKIEDRVISYNSEKNIFEEDIVKHVYINSNMSINENMYELEFDNGTKINITGNHKILTTKGYIRVDKLTEKDEIINF